jgi:hypothetical protein
MLDKLVGLFKRESSDEYAALFESIEKCVMEKAQYIYAHTRLPFNECEDYQTLKALPSDKKIVMLFALAKRTNRYTKRRNDFNTPDRKIHDIDANLLDVIMRTKFDFPEGFSFPGLFDSLYDGEKISGNTIALDDRPIGAFVTQIEKHIKKLGLYDDLRKDIERILSHGSIAPYLKRGSNKGYWGPDVGKAVQKLRMLLHNNNADGAMAGPPYQLGSGPVGKIIKQDVQTLPEEEQAKWHALFHHLSTASGGKPSKKFITTANPLVDAIGAKPFKTLVNQWLKAAAHLDANAITQTNTYNKREYTYTTHEYIESYSHNLLKGLLWSICRFHDQESLQAIALLTEKCFQKIPEQGPAAAGVGNAGIYTLALSKSLGGISYLSRLKLRIRQNNAQKLIQKYIDEQAERLSITPAQVEELSVPDFGLEDGIRIEMFDDYQLRLSLTGVGRTELQWFKPDGNAQKTVPAFVKNSAVLSARLKKMRDLAKQVKQASSAQRDRMDRLYIEELSWNLETFSQYYLDHGLVSRIARNLIWCIDDRPGIYIDGGWQDRNGGALEINPDAKISLWHPIHSDAETVLAWRDRLEVLKIKQPFKQAYREIYLLTDAEINTRIYSNRMAAHILKQHQFNSLAALRGWKYSLLGAYDDGRDGETASKAILAHKLEAQFWINEIIDDTDSFNDAGIWFYIATDQVRFCDENDEAIMLVDVPPLIFSEIMRDVDLFVGVASVGNDPTWQDGGPDARPAYRDYWQSYSFGDLTEVAKTRKLVLERLLPHLKIRDVASIDGKFLVVNGKRNSYKIHIGSGNILIKPNDRYLCIVPSRGQDKNLDKVFLPFEGDNGLSIVLSKAFLLAEDDKIEDPTILSQL